MNDLFSLAGYVAIVTGSGRGIGRACALALARAGADVVVSARTQQSIDAVAEEIRGMGRHALAVSCDVNDSAARTALVERTVAELGKVTLLVNNAGGTGPNDPLKMSPEAFAAALTWNVVPAYAFIQKCVPHMRAAGGGAVVNISSVAARYIQKHFSVYSAAKAALNKLTANLAQDFGPDVRINAIEPGTILTDALKPYLTSERESRMLASTPLGRLGLPEDIANAAVFLCSPAASWITGKVLGVDGGVEAPNF